MASTGARVYAAGMKRSRPAAAPALRALSQSELVRVSGGHGNGLAGLGELAQHVDNPGQTPMKD